VNEDQLNQDEVKQRLAAYKDNETTDELYSFGLVLVNELKDRYKGFDDKATKIAGYAGAVIALLISQFRTLRNLVDPWAMYLVLGAALLSLVSAGIGINAISLSQVDWFSPEEWFEKDSLSDAQKLKRFRVFTMYGVRQSYLVACEKKARRITYALRTLLVSGALLLVAMIDATIRGIR
jgi:hypothetical protein